MKRQCCLPLTSYFCRKSLLAPNVSTSEITALPLDSPFYLCNTMLSKIALKREKLDY